CGHIVRIGPPDGPLVECVTIVRIKFVSAGNGFVRLGAPGHHCVNLALAQPGAGGFFVDLQGRFVFFFGLRNQATAEADITPRRVRCGRTWKSSKGLLRTLLRGLYVIELELALDQPCIGFGRRMRVDRALKFGGSAAKVGAPEASTSVLQS